jgi:hypothetical protein
MLDTAEALRLMLATLALGVTLPVMIQLFLLIRQARKTIARMSAQIEPSLRVLNEIAQRPRASPPEPSSQLAAIVANIIPAAIAAYRAYRQHQHQTEEAAQSDLLAEGDCDPKSAAASTK